MSKRNPYVRPMPTSWWWHHAYYRFYILREATSLFVAAYSLFLLMGLFSLTKGEASWNSFVATMQSPSAVIFHLICLVMVGLHTVTWFSLTPKTMELRIKGEEVPAKIIVTAQYISLAIFALIAVIVVGGGV